MNVLATTDLELSSAAMDKFVELIDQVEDEIEGVRVYAQAGGCSGMGFGMTFTDAINADDLVREQQGVKIVVGADTIEHLRGAQIDFIDRGDGNQTFVFNNIPQFAAASGCGTCGSAGGGCG